MMLLVAAALVTVVGVAATLRAALTDDYRRVPTR